MKKAIIGAVLFALFLFSFMGNSAMASVCSASIHPQWTVAPGSIDNFEIYISLNPGTNKTMYIWHVMVYFKWLPNGSYDSFMAFYYTSGGATSTVWTVNPGQVVKYDLDEVQIPANLTKSVVPVKIVVTWGYGNDYNNQFTNTINTTIPVDVNSNSEGQSTTNQPSGTTNDLVYLIAVALLVIISVLVIVAVYWSKRKGATRAEVKTPEPAQPAPSPPQSHSDDVTEKLAKLKELRERDLITEEEYQERKREILDNI